MTTLITAFEVVKYSPVKHDYPTSYICDHIYNKELKLFNGKNLLRETYTKLVADLIEYSNVTEWDIDDTYNENDIVLLDGCIYVSLEDTNTNSPVDSAYWMLAPKFNTACYNVLWVNFLRRYLAYNIIYTSIQYSTYQATSKGLTKQLQDNTGSGVVNKDEFFGWKREILDDAKDILENMIEWMGDNLTCFPELETTGICSPTAKKVHRGGRISWII